MYIHTVVKGVIIPWKLNVAVKNILINPPSFSVIQLLHKNYTQLTLGVYSYNKFYYLSIKLAITS